MALWTIAENAHHIISTNEPYFDYKGMTTQSSDFTALHICIFGALPSPRALLTTNVKSKHHEEAKRKKAGGKLKSLPQVDMQKGA